MKHKLFLLAIILMAMAIPQTVKAYDFSYTYLGQTLYYNIVGCNAEVTYQNSSSTSYNSLTGSLEIPSVVTYNGATYSVASIGDWAFQGCSDLTSVTIGNSVTSIGRGSFHSCSGLTSITIPNLVDSIGWEAFDYCVGLIAVNFNADSCTYAGGNYSRGTFFYCPNINHFVFGDNVKVIPSRLCAGLLNLTSITIPDSVTYVGDYAFEGCSVLTSIAIPNTVISIGNGAFLNCDSLASVTIPNGVTTIGWETFANCSHLSSITIPNTVTSIGWGAFSGCSSLTSVIIPNSVTFIGKEAFWGCYSLAAISIPDSVTNIRKSTFEGCTSLTSVSFPNTVTNIDSLAFASCSNLTSITIPGRMTSIGQKAFHNCSSLRKVVSKAVYPPTCGSDAFLNVPPYCTLTVPCGSLNYYNVTEPWMSSFPIKEEDCGGNEAIDDVEEDIPQIVVSDGSIRVDFDNQADEAAIYALKGVRVATLTPGKDVRVPIGVYLVKVGEYPARKVVVMQ